MIAMITGKFPDSITKIIDGTTKLRCRISWKVLATGDSGHGDWFGLEDEGILQANVDAINKEYAGKISHWLEYE